jgi:tRNA pseudouridine32 synthase/23S rRNA pseudouridine746 synthase
MRPGNESMMSEEIVSRVLYRDALMLVVDKPAGLPVHPGPKGGETLVHHLDALRFGLPRRPEVAHRLDKDTSGCLVLGRHPKALARLGELFKRNEVDKVYWAVVEGSPEAEEGEIDLALAPKSPDRGWWMKVDQAGQPALTRWRVMGRSGECAPLTLLELRPVTGRTHQLRVHCAAMGWPILGDPIYGRAPRFGGPGLHLHARAVTVPLYPKKPPITVEAPAPAHMRDRLAACGR